ncbi:unnamed protein product [Lampetra planeri]
MLWRHDRRFSSETGPDALAQQFGVQAVQLRSGARISGCEEGGASLVVAMLVLSEATGSQRAALSSKSAVAASCETADGRTRSKRTFDNGDGGDDIKIVERLNVALGGHVLVRLASAQMCFALRPTGAAVVNAQRRMAALDSLVALSTRPPWSAHRTRFPRDAEQRRSVPCKGFVRMCHAAPMRRQALEGEREKKTR